ncbi:helix-turn-helix domain-containing protein [Aeromonas caviae]|uniref:Helix-turn-helix domain-containing protein n=1 Tax=Aeromonas caviae TaxID=648 RepID=A0A7T3X2D3_AERCA|nr:helix-turn-helix domain-containing protein [Aeromonas caviae]
MQILKAYKFRLEPTEQQAQRLRQLGGCARYVWNHGLAETKRILDAGEKLPSPVGRKTQKWPFWPRHIPTTSSRSSRICMARGCAALIRNSPPRHPYSRKKATTATLSGSSTSTSIAALKRVAA